MADLLDSLPADSPFKIALQQQQNALGGLNPSQTLAPLPADQADSLLTKVTNKALGGLAYAGSSLGKAFGGRAIRGLLGGNMRELASIIPFSDALGITDPDQEVRGEDLLKQWGALDGDGEKGTFERFSRTFGEN